MCFYSLGLRPRACQKTGITSGTSTLKKTHYLWSFVSGHPINTTWFLDIHFGTSHAQHKHITTNSVLYITFRISNLINKHHVVAYIDFGTFAQKVAWKQLNQSFAPNIRYRILTNLFHAQAPTLERKRLFEIQVNRRWVNALGGAGLFTYSAWYS